MRKSYLLIVSCLAFLGTAFAQEENAFSKNYDPVRLELEEWDPIRGPWLSSSLEAMSKQEPIPDRTFPEDITPAQMVAALPEKTRTNVERIAMENTNGNETEQSQWNEIRRVIVRPGAGCGKRTARTYGEPHLVTFDGARYSFQTVGEFVLTKSTSGLEVQSRQKAIRDDFSVNTAIAMNVGGDRVGIYASDMPGSGQVRGNRGTPVMVNGRPVTVQAGKAYFLDNGGTITRSGNTYAVTWPTGEVVQTRFHGWFMNDVSVQITDCSEGVFDGLLGNANGVRGDDFRGMNDVAGMNFPRGGGILGAGSREMEQQRLAFLANSLGDAYRVTQFTSLFDYGIGQSTLSFTDRSFPRVHRTMSEIPQNRRDQARRNCQNQGISQQDMNGCIFDMAYLDMDPVPTPIVRDPSEGIVFEPIRERTPNVNKEIEEAGKETETSDKPRLTPLPIPEAKEKPALRDRVIKSDPVDPVKEERTTPRPERTPTPAPAPVRSTPVRTTSPRRSTPTRTTSPAPVRSTPARTTSPTRATPTRTTSPTRSTPTPTRTTPTRSTPTRSVPTRGGGK
ncbi:MAG: VWD domain-containing protein [Crocinitomicaceae bacterium]|nr:VWD domain-containing protein [Flavobacteriales bacterium]NQZ37343.1 VWD domain-containing protein [Crocinitomicaceae bacterium]